MNLLLPPDLNNEKRLLKSADNQIVVIGANGAGKTRFSDRLIAELGDRAYRLSALEALYGTPYGASPSPELLDSLYRKTTAASTLFASDIKLMFDKLIAVIMGEEIANLISYKLDVAEHHHSKLPVTRLDRLIHAWQEIFPQNKVLIRNGELLFSNSSDDTPFSGLKLSDGEKVVLYYIGAVLYAPYDSYVFVDNPGLFLHPSVTATVWNKIESLRNDCRFVYTTHDLEFASSRSGSTVVWVRGYDAMKDRWDYDVLEGKTGIPEEVYLTIIGARKPVLFIEGDADHSIDSKLYPLIFKDFTVRSLGSCNKVIEAVRTFNDLKGFHHLDSYGIVDRDRREVKEVEYLRRKKILVPEVAEIENLLMLEEVIRAVAGFRKCNENEVFSRTRKAVMDYFRMEYRKQALEHTRHRVKRTVEYRIDRRFADINKLEEHMLDLVNEINPRGIYNEMCREFTDLLKSEDYHGILKVFNQKRMLSVTGLPRLLGLGSADDYLRVILRILNSDRPEADAIRRAVLQNFNASFEQVLNRQ
ncbi:MAG: DUF4435 domain-containing protein [Muribaculaceae bacterium]|nr:DUF4435 domain-containing protein [Muribaculaceae bacterium]